MKFAIACPPPSALVIRLGCRFSGLLFSLILLGISGVALAQDTVCARVKIQILQSLTLERQAFDATMKINNTTDTGVIENVAVVVKVTDENGIPVAVTDNPNDLAAKFFLRLFSKQGIAAVDGSGTVNPQTTATIDWQLIPAPGSAGSTPLGKKYWVGATLSYRFNGVDTALDVSPDVITVKPLPLLSLDYFLPQDVWGDDPLTPAIEPIEPFTLGVRVKNTGLADANNLHIDSAQPKIIENNQGLLINFTLLGSYVNDAPVQDTLNIDFGNVTAGTSTMGRWIMETTLAGKFTEFTATFSHSDALGGALTSLFQGVATHFLIQDVRVDLPGRDTVRDFLAQDGDVIRVYESNGLDTQVTDRSGDAVLTVGTDAAGTAGYSLSFPPTSGFVFVKLPDPFSGQRVIGQTVRSDGKALGTENVWLSKTRNAQTKQVQYWVNFFDVNSTGLYAAQFAIPPAASHPPVIQLIPGHTIQEQRQVSFLVEASSPDGKPVTLSATPLPAGSTLTPQAADPTAPGVSRAIFDWTPARNTAGDYPIVYTASDGTLSSTSSATIHVQVNAAAGIALPEVGNDSGTTRKNVNLTLAVFANDSLAANSTGFDPATLDLDPATPAVDITRTVPGIGTFTANPSGTVGFAPLPSFTGVSTISYRVQDNLGQASNPANLTVTVTGPGNPTGDTATDGPVANPDHGTTLLNTPVTLNIKSNDVAGPGQALNLASIDLDTGTNGVQPTQTTSAGVWKSNNDGTVTFTPTVGYSGIALLTYAIADSSGKTAQSTVTIAVSGGATPLAQNDSGATPQNTPVNLAILDNDTPSAGQALVPGKVDLDPSTPDQLDGAISTAEGNWTANSNGILSFAPTGSYKSTNLPFTGSTPPLTYTVADSSGQIATASIGITVNPTTAPTAVSASANTAFNTPVNQDPASKGTASPGAILDPTTLDLNPATAAVDQSISAAEGTWTVNADGTVSFTPALNFNGTSAAQPYLVRDSLGHSANAYLNVTVALPVSVSVTGTVFQDVNLDQVQDGGEPGTNVGGLLYITAVNAGYPVATSAVAVDGGYSLALTPHASYTLVLSDNPQGSATASLPTGWGNTGENNNGKPVGAIDGTLYISIGVATLGGQSFGVTQGPHASNDSASTAYGISVNATVASNDTYPNGSVFTKVDGPSHGAATLNQDGSYSYTPMSGFSGSDSFAYQVCLPSPNSKLCDTATVGIAVAAPIIPADLRIQMAADTSQPAVGRPYGYTLTISNSGGPTTNPVQLSNALPSGVKLIAVQTVSGWNCAPVVSTTQPLQGGNGATLACNHAGPLPVGSQTITLTAVATASSIQTNQVTITGDGQTPDTVSCLGSALANCSEALVTPTNPTIELLKQVSLPPANETVQVDGQSQAGEQLAYTFALSNRGDTDLTSVLVSDSQLDANSLSCNALTNQNNPFSLNGPNNLLRSNESASCTGKHTVTAAEASAGRIDNTATAKGKAADGTTVQSVSTGIWVNALPQGQIVLAQTAIHKDANLNGEFDIGETVGFTFIVRNTGTVNLDTLKVSAPLLTSPEYVIDCPVAMLTVGEQTTTCAVSPDYSLTAADVAAGKLVNHAVATATDPASKPISDSDTLELVSGEPASLALVKTATLSIDQGQVGLSVGDTLAYTLVATNTGAVALTKLTLTDDKPGTALSASDACLPLPGQGQTLSPGTQMVCTATHVILEGEANPIANTAKASGKPVGRAATVNADGNHVVPYQQPPASTLYTFGGVVWLDANNNGLYEPALGETGINGVDLHLLLCAANGANCVQALDANSAAIADRATAGGGVYQFTDVPVNATGKVYKVQVLPVNFLTQSFGTRPLYGKLSSKIDDAAAFPWVSNRDQGVGITPSATDGILSRAFDLHPLAATVFGNVNFGFVASAVPTVPDLEITLSASQATVAPGGTLTFTVQADNAVGAGNITGRPMILDNLPSGMTVKAGWPTVQPTGWLCLVTTGRNQVACSYTGSLPVAGGASLGAAIQIPVVAPKTAGMLTNTVTITKLPSEISYTNNAASASVKVGP